MATGIFIKTFPLTGYPSASQILMNKIVEDFKENQISVTKYKGSYSILKGYGETIVKILCTIGSNVTVEGVGVVVLFRAEHINSIGFEKIGNSYPALGMRKVLYKVGAGKYEDFYLVKIESDEDYDSKSNDILNLTKLFFNTNFYQ
jgi:hypothetical protein